MLLQGAMPEIGLEIELEVGCVGGCRGCMVAVPKDVRRMCVRRVCRGCAEGVQRVCRGCAEVSVDGEISTCPMLEDVWWLCQRMCGACVIGCGRACVEGCEGLWRVSCYNIVSL